ncbi:hypothetical protein [Microbaculum marinum]|uniref:Uncharacterized protein n=1 Tax=Microbaculum marinum TaxID=1764581 RepID=A0AAW9S2W7_9HYPH
MRPVLIASIGALIGAVLGVPAGYVAGALIGDPTEACSGTACGFFGSIMIIAGLFGGAVIGAVVGLRLSRPEGRRPPAGPRP